MASWAHFEAIEPEFASRVRTLLTRRKHLTMATLRRDGSPRISGTEIDVSDGELAIGSMAGAMKAKDLRRDSRVAIHGPTEDPPTGHPEAWSGEVKLAGRAVAVESEGPDDRFRIDLQQVVITHLNDAGDRLVVEIWDEARGYRKVERE